MEKYKMVRNLALEYATRKVDRFGTWEHIADISRHEIRMTSQKNALPANWEQLRKQRFEMDKGICQICGKPVIGTYMTDHVIQRSNGGTNELSNLRTTHPLCHSDRHPGNARLRVMAERLQPSERKEQLRAWVKGYVGGGSE